MLDLDAGPLIKLLLLPVGLIFIFFIDVDDYGNWSLTTQGVVTLVVFAALLLWFVVDNLLNADKRQAVREAKEKEEKKRKEEENLEQPLLEKLYGDDAKKFGITPKECETIHLEYIRYWYDCVRRGKKNISNFEEYAVSYLKENNAGAGHPARSA
jgi:hypothetical protein